MNESKVTDRVIIEVRGGELTREQISHELRLVAAQIACGIKGGTNGNTNVETLWEHECTDYGFRMGDKSLIAMHYYGAPKPRVISEELASKAKQWLDMSCERDSDESYKYTDGYLVDAATDIMKEIAEGGES